MAKGSPNDMHTTISGHLPTVTVPLSADAIDGTFKLSDKDKSVVIGLQFIFHGYVLATWQLSTAFHLSHSEIEGLNSNTCKCQAA